MRSVLSVALIGGAVAVFAAMGTSDPPQPKSNNRLGRPVVETVDVAVHEGGIEFEVDGVVVPLREIRIAAEVQGRVDFKAEYCRIGRYVRQGDLLIRLDPRDYEIEFRRLEQDLEQAEGSLEELEADLASNKNDIALDRDEVSIRKRELLRFTQVADPGVFSKTEVDVARRNELVARSALQTSLGKSRALAARRRRLEGARETVKSRLNKARLDLDRTEIVAPISGIITQEEVEQDGFAQAGMALVVIQDTDNIEVKCSLHARQEQWLWMASHGAIAPSLTSEQGRDVPRLGESQQSDAGSVYEIPRVPVTVSYSHGPRDWVWQGTLTRYDGSGFDEQTRMVPVRVRVENPLSELPEGGDRASARSTAFTRKSAQSKRVIPCEIGTSNRLPRVSRRPLKKGMFVRVKIRVMPQTKLVRLPQSAVRPGNVVWTVENGMLQHVNVEPVHTVQGHVLLFQDQATLRPGTQVVVSPLANPNNGRRIAIAERRSR